MHENRCTVTVNDDGVAHLRLTRVAGRNAIDRTMVEAIAHATDSIEADDRIRSLLITGDGPPSFCVGGDLKYFTDNLDTLADEFDTMVSLWHRTLPRLAELPYAVVTAIHGGHGRRRPRPGVVRRSRHCRRKHEDRHRILGSGTVRRRRKLVAPPSTGRDAASAGNDLGKSGPRRDHRARMEPRQPRRPPTPNWSTPRSNAPDGLLPARSLRHAKASDCWPPPPRRHTANNSPPNTRRCSCAGQPRTHKRHSGVHRKKGTHIPRSLTAQTTAQTCPHIYVRSVANSHVLDKLAVPRKCRRRRICAAWTALAAANLIPISPISPSRTRTSSNNRAHLGRASYTATPTPPQPPVCSRPPGKRTCSQYCTPPSPPTTSPSPARTAEQRPPRTPVRRHARRTAALRARCRQPPRLPASTIAARLGRLPRRGRTADAVHQPYLADRTWPMEILHGVTAKLRFHGDVALLVAAELHQAAGDLDTAIWTVAHAQPTAHAALPPSSSTPTNPVCQNRIHRLPDSPVHGGPYPPATSAPSTTSVGSLAIERFLRRWPTRTFPRHCSLQRSVPGIRCRSGDGSTARRVTADPSAQRDRYRSCTSCLYRSPRCGGVFHRAGRCGTTESPVRSRPPTLYGSSVGQGRDSPIAAGIRRRGLPWQSPRQARARFPALLRPDPQDRGSAARLVGADPPARWGAPPVDLGQRARHRARTSAWRRGHRVHRDAGDETGGAEPARSRVQRTGRAPQSLAGDLLHTGTDLRVPRRTSTANSPTGSPAPTPASCAPPRPPPRSSCSTPIAPRCCRCRRCRCIWAGATGSVWSGTTTSGVDTCDYWVDPTAIGRIVEVIGDLEQVWVRLDGRPIAEHRRCWARQIGRSVTKGKGHHFDVLLGSPDSVPLTGADCD